MDLRLHPSSSWGSYVNRFVLFFCCAFVGLTGPCASVLAAGNTSHQPRPLDWGQRDTAVYVVSTLNLLHSPRGGSMATRLTRRLGIARFDVYADTRVTDLYFIELRRQNGDIAGAFAYQMGWVKPLSVTAFCDRLGAPRAPARIVESYRNDSRQFIGSFTSTMPS